MYCNFLFDLLELFVREWGQSFLASIVTVHPTTGTFLFTSSSRLCILFLKGGIYMRKNTKQIQTNSLTTIKKSNELTLAKVNHGLTLNQMQLMSFAILNTQQNGRTEFTKVEFQRQYGLTQYNTQYAFKDSQKVTTVQYYLFNEEEDSFFFQNLFSSMHYKEGIFKFKWNPDVVQHVLDLKDKYITEDIMITAKFKSSYTWILYEFLKAKYGFWFLEVTPDYLKQIFGVENVKSYVNNGKFKSKVLDKAVDELNKYTEYEVRYEEIKRGNKIIKFKLIWSIGSTVQKAYKEQLEELTNLFDVAFEDYNLDYKYDFSVTEQQQAKQLLDQLMHNKALIGANLTYSYANKLLEESRMLFKQLNNLVNTQKNANTCISANEDIPDVPLVDWLKK